MPAMTPDQLWKIIREEAQQIAAQEPLLAHYLRATILDQPSLADTLGVHLARLLVNSYVNEVQLRKLIAGALQEDPDILVAACRDIEACRERDAACTHYVMPLLYFKGFQALQVYRIAHYCFRHGQQALAYFLQHLVSRTFSVDIHPAARIGSGILMDHATGVVIGETAVVEDNVSMLHGVTLGGSGIRQGCARHPTIRRGVLLSTGAKVLGCIEVGEGAKVAAGSLVLETVPPHTTVAGIPARVVGRPSVAEPALALNHDVNQ